MGFGHAFETICCCLVAKSHPTHLQPCQVPLSVGFHRQEGGSKLTFPSPGDLPDSGIRPISLALAGAFVTNEILGKPHKHY